MCYIKFDGNDCTYSLDTLALEKDIILPNPILNPKGQLVAVKGRLTNIKMISVLAPISSAFYESYDEYRKKQFKAKLGAVIGIFNLGPAAASAALDRPRGSLEMCVFIQAQLDGQPIEGWIGYGQFHENDEVKVVVDKSYAEHWQVYAIARPKDHVISILPRCDQGKKPFIKFSWGLYLKIYVPCIFALASFMFMFIWMVTNLPEAVVGAIAILLFFQIAVAFVGRSLYVEGKNSYVPLAEKIFAALGWPNISSISLPNMNKKHVRKLIQQGEYRNWDEKKDTGTKPTPTCNYLSGFFYYDKELDDKTE